MGKKYFLGAIFFSIILIAIFFRSDGQPLNPIREKWGGIVDNIEVIDTVKKENGTMVYSVGEANNGNNYMYSVDMVKNTLTGYKWLGGGGHVNQDIPMNNDFILSVQLLNEKQNLYPTLLGVLKNSNISKITVKTYKESVNAIFYDVKKGERFYIIPFSNNVSGSSYFKIIMIDENGTVTEHIVSGEEISILQEGKVFYFNKEDFQ
jgi:hypothetical protein